MFRIKFRYPNKIYRNFMNLKLSSKLLLGYVIILLLPTIALEFYIYNQNYQLVVDQYTQTEYDTMQAAKKNFHTQLNQISEISSYLNSSTTLEAYMAGNYLDVAEELYYYIRDIRPLIKYVMAASPNIEDISFYGLASYELNWGGALLTPTEDHIFPSYDLNSKEILGGIWTLSQNAGQPAIFYQRPIYNMSYSRLLGWMEIRLNAHNMFDNFSSLTGPLYFYSYEDNLLYAFDEGILKLSPLHLDEVLHYGWHINQEALEEINGQLIQTLDTSYIRYNGKLLLGTLFILFLLLSLVYYFIASTITRRITSLKQHITLTDAQQLTVWPGHTFYDEIGSLASSYNQMIERINHLIHENYQTELEKKDAQFYALQAQIEPHFLYNILENIHMSAVKHDDSETAAMVHSLGKYMRYNLNNSVELVSLTAELDNARNYLEIHKIRMKNQLQTEILAYTEIDPIFCPRFIIQPLLENCIKHGYEPDRRLLISLSVKAGPPDSQAILIEIQDNGRGLSEEKLRELHQSLAQCRFQNNSHVGLVNVHSRLKSYWPLSGLNICSKPDEGTTIWFLLKTEE